MELSLSLILLAVGVIVLNILDSATTRIALNQTSDTEFKAEGNPIMRWVMRRNRKLAEVIKQVVLLGMVAICLFYRDSATLTQLAILLGFVVLNNSYTVIAQAITKRQQASPLERLILLLHVPRKFRFLVVVAVLASLMIFTYKVIL